MGEMLRRLGPFLEPSVDHQLVRDQSIPDTGTGMATV